MFAVKYLRNNHWPFLAGILNGAFNSFLALFCISALCDQLFCQTVWSSASFVIYALIGFYFYRLIQLFSLPKKIISCLIFLCLEIYLNVAWIYPGSYFIFYGSHQALQHDICCETPKDYGAADYQTLKIAMSDGVHIEGWYVAPSQPEKATVILVHGSENDRRHGSDQAHMLISAGYGVFMYDQRGNGQSEGVLDYVNPRLGKDLIEVANALKEKFHPKQLAVVGLSLGAHAAIGAAEQEPHLFSALWLDGLQAQSFKDFAALDFTTYIEARILFLEISFVDRIRNKDAEGYNPVTDILPTLQATPITLVAGAGEKFESSANQKYAELTSKNLHVWMVPDGGHLTAVSDYPEEYRTNMIGFFDAALTEKETSN